jgi:hypothetical protein
VAKYRLWRRTPAGFFCNFASFAPLRLGEKRPALNLDRGNSPVNFTQRSKARKAKPETRMLLLEGWTDGYARGATAENKNRRPPFPADSGMRGSR